MSCSANYVYQYFAINGKSEFVSQRIISTCRANDKLSLNMKEFPNVQQTEHATSLR